MNYSTNNSYILNTFYINFTFEKQSFIKKMNLIIFYDRCANFINFEL